MACCKEDVIRSSSVGMEALPDKTFCCMARMAYNICQAAESVIVGTEKRDWAYLSEDEQNVMARLAKDVAVGRPLSEPRPLFEAVLKTMVYNV